MKRGCQRFCCMSLQCSRSSWDIETAGSGVNLGAKVFIVHAILRFLLGTFMSHAFYYLTDIYMAPKAEYLRGAEGLKEPAQNRALNDV